MKKSLDEKDHYNERIKVLEEENRKLKNENNDLIGQLKVIKKITEGY